MKVISVVICLSLALVNSVLADTKATGTLLVLNKSDNTVSMIDLASRKVLATLPTGVGPHEAAVSPDAR